MKIALIGASGFVGSAILEEVTKRGHSVTALARNPEKIKANPLVTSVKIDIYKQDELVKAINNHDVVVSAFSPGWGNPNISQEIMKGNKAIQDAIKKSNVKRLFMIGGAGSLFAAPGIQLVDTPQFPAEWKTPALALRDFYNIIKEEKELEWTFLSPAIEMHQGTSGVRKGIYRTGLENPVFKEDGRSVISVEDMAIAIADELENKKFIRKRFTVGY